MKYFNLKLLSKDTYGDASDGVISDGTAWYFNASGVTAFIGGSSGYSFFEDKVSSAWGKQKNYSIYINYNQTKYTTLDYIIFAKQKI